ncbi:hypothetical protein AYI69_g7389 [Smittium culicis]|uniref:Retrovirus-related Pol polyprotein from transposon n=1 Tax=Smittium culicis TaxID=133412 RepID=A0A1R1XSB6_9FUNG|nr:hypothetical protein AYI69_g7389 [Smittium culicis]
MGSKDSFIEETEIYTIIKENIQDGLGVDIVKDDRLVDIINKNSDMIVHEIEQLSQTNVVEHKIEITENRPIKQMPYRISFILREMVTQEIKKMEEVGFISSCNSEWCSPVVTATEKKW